MRYGNIRQIEAFRCLMVTGSMTMAARMMGVTQPAISRLLRDLQAELKLTLLEKRGTGVAPTAEATSLYAEVERSFVGLDRIRASAEEIRTRRTDSLRIAALPALANGFLPRFAGRFLAARPQLDLGLFGVITPLVVDWVANRQCDIGFAEMPLANPGLDIAPMPVLPRVAVVPEGHRLAQKSVITPKDFEGENFISLKHGAGSRFRIDRAFAERGINRVMRVETHLSEIMCGLVSSGFGVAICDPFTAAEFAGRGVVARPFKPRIPFDFGVLHPPGPQPSSIAQEFIAEFSAHILACYPSAQTEMRA
ncbi:MAG: transcriptional regulator [Rhizobiales bacterium PAR1]|nr:MAG: transcriptional regulator [Rhizobiales bacterium PAR1]